MILQRVRHAAYTDDDPPIVRALRNAAEQPPRGWGPFLMGWFTQGVVVGILFVDFAGPSPQPPKKEARRTTRLFLPAPRTVTQVKPNTPKRKSLVAKVTRPKVEYRADAPPIKGRVDMNSIEISIVDDSENQLPEVIRQHQGILALVDRDDRSIARYVFEPPDWRMHDQMMDVSGRIRFAMSPPSRWALLQTLADQNSIPIEKYQVDALFDSSYAGCLELEIRKQAQASHNPGRVSAAILVFTSSRSCGINVVDLKFTNQ